MLFFLIKKASVVPRISLQKVKRGLSYIMEKFFQVHHKTFDYEKIRSAAELGPCYHES